MFKTWEKPKKKKRKITTNKKKSDLAFKSSYSAPKCYFSNFFGGSEFTFMSKRTTNPRLCKLYLALRDREWDTEIGYINFQKCREKLMGKKIYTEKYRDPYYKKNGTRKVAAGLLAKLISGCWRKPMEKRLKVVNTLAEKLLGPVSKDESDITQHDFSHECLDSSKWTYLKQGSKPTVRITATNETIEDANVIKGWLIRDDTKKNKKQWMKEALADKYSQLFFKQLLMESEDGIYEAKGGRDTAPLWCGLYREESGVPVQGLLQQCLRETKQQIVASVKQVTAMDA